MADAMLQIIENPLLREALVANGFEYVARHGWDVKRKDYLNLVDALSVETFGQSIPYSWTGREQKDACNSLPS